MFLPLMIMKPKHLVSLALLACIGRSTWASQGSSVCKQQIMYNRTYHSTYGSSPDIKAKDNKVVRRCDHNPVYPCWNYCTCGTSGVWEVQVIGTSYDDFAQLSIDGKIVPGLCAVDDICTCPCDNNKTTDPQSCAIGCGVVISILIAIIVCCTLLNIPYIRNRVGSYCHDRIPWRRDNCGCLPTSNPSSDAQHPSGSEVSNFQDRSLSHPPLPGQQITESSQLPEGVEETQPRRRTGPTASFQRTTGNSDSSEPPLPAAMTDDTQLSGDQEPTDEERVEPPTEVTGAA